MGMANMDFVIRECQAVVDGPLAMVRLGTCGAVQPPAHLGSFLVASEGSVCVRCTFVLLPVNSFCLCNIQTRIAATSDCWRRMLAQWPCSMQHFQERIIMVPCDEPRHLGILCTPSA